MAQLRYTKYAAVCGTAALTAGLFGIYFYKQRAAKKDEDKQLKNVNSEVLKKLDVEESELVVENVSDSVVQSECICEVNQGDGGNKTGEIVASVEKVAVENRSENDLTSAEDLPSSTNEAKEQIAKLEASDIIELKSSLDEIEEPLSQSVEVVQESAPLPPAEELPSDKAKEQIARYEASDIIELKSSLDEVEELHSQSVDVVQESAPLPSAEELPSITDKAKEQIAALEASDIVELKSSLDEVEEPLSQSVVQESAPLPSAEELPSITDKAKEQIAALEAGDIVELKSSLDEVEEPLSQSVVQESAPLPPADSLCDLEEDGNAASVSSLTLDWATTCTTVEQVGNSNKDESLASPTVSLQSHPEGSVAGSDLSTETNSDSSSFDSGRCTASISSCTGSQQLPQPQVQEMPTVYQFEFPTKECGRLIGKAGKNIKGIRNRSGARLNLQDCPGDESKQICTIEGFQSEIDAALLDIQKKFPAVDTSKQYIETPQVTAPTVAVPEMSQIYLHDEIVNDVLVSSVVSAGHVFIQQPTHPTYMALTRLNSFMNNCYSQMDTTPPLPRPVEVGVICAAPIMQGWYRAQVVDIYPDTDEVDLKFLDYGGYARAESCFLKQIRTDFMSLPFQASECYMANIAPLKGEDDFSETARVFVEQVAQSFAILQAQVTGYSKDGIPFIELFYTDSERRVQSLNKELVNQGLVTWYEEGIQSSGDTSQIP